jgi:predicted transglutaminase-like cysteine proteinase
MQHWLNYKLYPLQQIDRMTWNGNPVDPGYFTFDWHVDTPEVQQFLNQEKIRIKEITDAVEKGQLGANTQQYVQGVGKEAAIKAWILRDVHEFINKLIKGVPQKNWRSPQEIFKMKEGDCKSYVIAKMAMLKALGFKDEDIILIIGIIRANRFEEKFGELPTDAGHIVMGVNIHSQVQDPSDSWTFLDDLQDELGIDWGLYGFPMYLINNQNVWRMQKHVEVPPPSIPGHRRGPDDPNIVKDHL